MYSALKRQTLLLLDPTEGGTIWDRIINSFIVFLIILNTVAVIIESVDWIYIRYQPWFQLLETTSVVIFSIEYILRLWSCTSAPKYQHPLTGRIRYMFSFGAVIDLVAILPFYLPLLMGLDLRFIRLFRLVRFFRFFKLSRYMNASRVIGNVL